MRGKRFGLLAATLVVLNLVLWLAPPGLALRQAIVNQLFGPHLVRGEVIEWTGTTTSDIRLDRGVVTAQTPTDIVLHEVDGRQQMIPLTPATRIRRRSLVGWRVFVIWSANGAATSVQAEAKVAGQSGGHRIRHTARILSP